MSIFIFHKLLIKFFALCFEVKFSERETRRKFLPLAAQDFTVVQVCDARDDNSSNIAKYIITFIELLLLIIIITHHPIDTKFIYKHAKKRTPEGFFKRHHYIATF